MDSLPKESIRKVLQAEQACAQAKTLANRLLTFAKGGQPIKQAHRLGEVLREAASLALSGSRSKLSIDLGEDLWAVEVDRGQMLQVFCNLIINADQAMPQGGDVAIKAENFTVAQGDNLPLEPGKFVRITIADQGPGIKPDNLDKIFDPYFTTKPKGSGLGLATAYVHRRALEVEHTGRRIQENVEGRLRRDAEIVALAAERSH